MRVKSPRKNHILPGIRQRKDWDTFVGMKIFSCQRLDVMYYLAMACHLNLCHLSTTTRQHHVQLATTCHVSVFCLWATRVASRNGCRWYIKTMASWPVGWYNNSSAISSLYPANKTRMPMFAMILGLFVTYKYVTDLCQMLQIWPASNWM